jgi:C4-dicarboxylate transporter DctQ subunit
MLRVFLRVLDRLEEVIIATLIAVATAIIFVAVLHRYASTVPVLFPYMHKIDMSWAQELCIYMFVWMAKFGAAYGVRTGIHVGVDVLINRLGGAPRMRVIIFGLLCGAAFTSIIGTLGASFVWHMAHTDQTSNDLEVPVWIVYLAIPLGSYLMCFRFLQVAYIFARTGELPHHDHAYVEGVTDDVAAAKVQPVVDAKTAGGRA